MSGETIIGTKSIEAMLAEMDKLVSRRSDAGQTVAEIARQRGLSVKRVRDLLKIAQERGRLAVGRKTYTAIDGRQALVAVYRILKK